MRPDPRLCGFTRDKFEKFGKPHVMCSYANNSIRSHELEEGAFCACCGKPATNPHHHPAGRHTVEIAGRALRPSLIALCGSGTTGCHDGFHGGSRFDALWAWDEERYAEEWISGSFMADGYGPHDPRLYLFGCWEFYDFLSGAIWRYRDGFEEIDRMTMRRVGAYTQRQATRERIGWTGGLDE